MKNTSQSNIFYSTAKALIRAAVLCVDAEGEYAAGDSYDRITVIDSAISIRISDPGNDPAIIEIEFDDVVVFRAIAESRDDFEVEVFHFGEWQGVVIEYSQSVTPSNDWTFGGDE